MSSSVEQIKSKIDIVTVIGSYIELIPAGQNYKAKCPFHNEKTPSFFVSPDRGSFYCFGCHKKGDMFTFVEEFEGVDFLGALKVLADRAGVKIEWKRDDAKTEEERLYSVLEMATFFFEKQLNEHHEAKEYITARGLSQETLQAFRVGYAPSDWRTLSNYLSSKGISHTDMSKVGLVREKEGSTPYDVFRDRIMFPIADSAGRIVGFSGRSLHPSDTAPKYLNTPETVLFKKSEVLFGLDKAKKHIRLKDYSILVEGQMDLVMLHQVGLGNTVAASGTALTVEHLTRLRRLSNRIIMAYDGDSAGFAAADRSAKLALSLGMELKIVTLPAGKDPADMAKENASELFARVGAAQHIIDFYTDGLLSRGLDNRTLGTEIRTHVLPYVALLPSAIERSSFVQSISKKTFIKEDALWDDLKHITVSAPIPEKPVTPESIRDGSFDALTRRAVGIILWQSEQKEPSIDVSLFEDRLRSIVGSPYDELRATLSKGKDVLIFETESYYNTTTRLRQNLEEVLLRLEEEHLKRSLITAMDRMATLERTKDSQKILECLEECQEISKKINVIKMTRMQQGI